MQNGGEGECMCEWVNKKLMWFALGYCAGFGKSHISAFTIGSKKEHSEFDNPQKSRSKSFQSRIITFATEKWVETIKYHISEVQ